MGYLVMAYTGMAYMVMAAVFVDLEHAAGVALLLVVAMIEVDGVQGVAIRALDPLVERNVEHKVGRALVSEM